MEASYPFAGTPPEGFGFDETSGAVALTLALASEGAGGDFVVRLTRAGSPIYSDAVVSLSVSALASPVQAAWIATLAGDGSLAGTHPIRFPEGFSADGFRTTILGVAGGSGDNFALTTGGLGSGSSAPLAGSYEITLGISHDDGFLGTLAAVVSARVGGYGEIDDADGIPAGALSASLRVAAGYEGEVHRVAAGGADVELLAGVLPQGLRRGGTGGRWRLTWLRRWGLWGRRF